MPNRVVEVHRWQVVMAFVVMVLIAIFTSLWNDNRIDHAELRISRNAARAADLERTNERQDAIRKALLLGLQRADFRTCVRIEALKRQNRLEAQRSFNNLSRNLRLLNLQATPALVRAAAQELAHDLQRNRATECRRE